MSITEQAAIEQSAIFTPRDLRDPLGIWGGRHGITGDATADFVKTQFFVPAAEKSSYIYTCYSAQIGKLTGAGVARGPMQCRLLTNWPNIDPQAGVQAYSTLNTRIAEGSGSFPAPYMGPLGFLIGPNDRFLPLFDPRPIGGNMFIVELIYEENVNTETYGFECYGYFWDRAVLDTPGGLRHPGSS